MARLIVALDRPDAGSALDLVERLDGVVDYFKVGLELFTREGSRLVEELRRRERRVFLDLKLHDIPNTVAGAVRSAAAMNVDMLTVHAAGGLEMMSAAAQAAGPDGPEVVAVTLLTSLSASDVETIWGKELLSVRDEVVRLAGLAAQAGLAGVVASPLEVEAIRRRLGPEFTLVTPGIRPEGSPADDQNRAATPTAAVAAGADYLVVGRPVYTADDPAAAARAILDALQPLPQTAP